MRTVGQRKQRALSLLGSAELLREGARFNESLQALGTGESAFIPKGVYFFKTLNEADLHRDDCLARGMALLARGRR